MSSIRQEDLIQSVADAFQYISYYHPLDYIRALGEAYAAVPGLAARVAVAEILAHTGYDWLGVDCEHSDIDVEGFTALARGSGWMPRAAWTDPDGMFSVHALLARD